MKGKFKIKTGSAEILQSSFESSSPVFVYCGLWQTKKLATIKGERLDLVDYQTVFTNADVKHRWEIWTKWNMPESSYHILIVGSVLFVFLRTTFRVYSQLKENCSYFCSCFHHFIISYVVQSSVMRTVSTLTSEVWQHGDITTTLAFYYHTVTGLDTI